jgi:hypothetical protein
LLHGIIHQFQSDAPCHLPPATGRGCNSPGASLWFTKTDVPQQISQLLNSFDSLSLRIWLQMHVRT